MQLIDHLDSLDAVRKLATRVTSGLTQKEAADIRVYQGLPKLIKALESHEKEKQNLVHGILQGLACLDAASSSHMQNEGIIRISCSHLKSPSSDDELKRNATLTLLACIRGLTQGAREKAYDDMFKLGAIGTVVQNLNVSSLSEASARLMGWVSSGGKERERLRDAGLIPSCVLSCRTSTLHPYTLAFVRNLALSESLLIVLRDCDALGIMVEILAMPGLSEPVRTSAVVTLALLATDQDIEAERILEQNDVSKTILNAFAACTTGNRSYGGLIWELGSMTKMAASLCQRESHAIRLNEAGIVPVLLSLISAGQSGGEVVLFCSVP